MTFRNKIMAFFTSVLLCSMLSSLSCSHSGGAKNGDDLFAGVGSDAPKDGDLSSDSGSDGNADASLGSIAKSESDPTATPPKDDMTALSQSTPATGSDSKGAAALMDEAKTGDASVTPLPANDTPAPAADVASLNNPPATPPVLTDADKKETPKIDAPTEPTFAPGGDAPKIDAAATVPTDAGASTTANTSAPKAADDQAGAKAKTKVAASQGASGTSLPSISTESIWRKGTALNRYYFIRRGDTPSALSELIYSSQGRDQDLLAWNIGEWKAGKIVYYVSPVDPNDSTMKSFYEERGIATEPYTVKRGDWLSKLAENMYGDPGSWKEIALANGMKTPDRIAVGTEIKLYPPKFLAANFAEKTEPSAPVASAKSETAKVAANESAPKSDTTTTAPNSVASVSVAPNSALANDVAKTPIPAPTDLKVEPVPLAAINPVPKAPVRHPDSVKLADPDVGGFFKEHLFGFFAAACVLLVAFLMIRRAKRADFFD
jgi:nucleoid-associated protein YgaU